MRYGTGSNGIILLALRPTLRSTSSSSCRGYCWLVGRGYFASLPSIIQRNWFRCVSVSAILCCANNLVQINYRLLFQYYTSSALVKGAFLAIYFKVHISHKLRLTLYLSIPIPSYVTNIAAHALTCQPFHNPTFLILTIPSLINIFNDLPCKYFIQVSKETYLPHLLQ